MSLVYNQFIQELREFTPLYEELIPLYDRYNRDLKPLISQYESRNEEFMTELLNYLSDFFDSIATFSKGSFESDTKNMDVSKRDAEMYLEQAIELCRYCLVATLTLNTKKFKKRFSTLILTTLDEGKFYGEFKKLYTTARKYKKTNMETTYKSLLQIEKLINDNMMDVRTHSVLAENKYMILGKAVITILISIFVNYIILKVF